MTSPLDKLKNGKTKPAETIDHATQKVEPEERRSPLQAKLAAARASLTTQTVLQDIVPDEMPQAVNSPLATRTNSPLAKPNAKRPRDLLLPVRENEIDRLGEDVGKFVGETTNRITSKFTVNNFGDLGDILTDVQIQADSLDMSEFTKGGLFGKIKRGLVDIRKVLYKRMTSAQGAFSELEVRIANQIAVLSEWNKDLNELYLENIMNHKRLIGQIRMGNDLIAQVEGTIARFPDISPEDPDAFVLGQQLNEANTVLNMLQIKVDTWNRLKIICESHGPNIQHKQQAGRNAVSTLRRLLTEIIPMVKMEFALHLHNLQMQKTITLVDSTRTMGNNVLTANADSSAATAIAAAKSANESTISTEALDHIRAKMLEAATGVNDIRRDAQKQRETDAVHLQQSQKEYYTALNSTKKELK